MRFGSFVFFLTDKLLVFSRPRANTNKRKKKEVRVNLFLGGIGLNTKCDDYDEMVPFENEHFLGASGREVNPCSGEGHNAWFQLYIHGTRAYTEEKTVELEGFCGVRADRFSFSGTRKGGGHQRLTKKKKKNSCTRARLSAGHITRTSIQDQ